MASVNPLDDPLGAVEDVASDVVKGIQRLTGLHYPRKVGNIPLKRSLSGYETEMFVLNNKGQVDSSGKLLKLAKKKGLEVQPESAKGMIEVLCLPHKRLRHTSLHLTHNLIQLSELAKKHEYTLHPFGTYPGSQKVVITNKPWYNMLQKMFGKDRFVNSGLCCGYHQHYTLPRGLFDEKAKMLRYQTSSKVKRTLLDSYNFLTAIDPVITCLLQSSPYVNNKYLAKDSRMLLYRGGKSLNYEKGKYSKEFEGFGSLSQYERTVKDLIATLKNRDSRWKELMIQKGFNPSGVTGPPNTLKFTWNPVKINPKGTIEYRGGDMNYLTNIIGISTMIKFSLRKIQQDFTLVTPMDIELKDAFKVEGNFLFVPPHTTVREELQHASAYEGLENPALRTYVNRCFKFMRKEVREFDNDYLPLLKPIARIIDEEATVSDQIISKVKKKGYKNRIPQSYAQELSLHYADEFEEDLNKAQKELLKYY